MPGKWSVGVIGATGAVGRELISILEQRSFPCSRLHTFASERSSGIRIRYYDSDYEVNVPSFPGLSVCDVLFFCASSEISKKYSVQLAKQNKVVIDNSSAFRLDPSVPLVVPEINEDAIRSQALIANPNCTAIIVLMAVAPLRALGKIERLIVSTYQSASGAGIEGMNELLDQTAAHLNGSPVQSRVFPHPYAFNLFSHNTPIDESGLNEEERKVIDESRKILSEPELKINATCIRVPVLRAHTASITVEFEGAAPEPDFVREALSRARGVRVVDEPAKNLFPMPSLATGQDDVFVGRIRNDPSNEKAICLIACGDQLRKGAALNAVQIAELLWKRETGKNTGKVRPC